jgi:hypothetical protein
MHVREGEGGLLMFQCFGIFQAERLVEGASFCLKKNLDFVSLCLSWIYVEDLV